MKENRVYQVDNSVIATNAKIIPIPYFRVIGSFNIKNAKSIVTKGDKAVVATTIDAFPLLIEYKKNSVPTAPANPERTAKVTHFAYTSGLKLTEISTKKMTRMLPMAWKI